MEKNGKSNIIIFTMLIAFFLLVIVLESEGQTLMLMTVLRKSAVYALAAVALNLLNGFTGLFSLGHAGFLLIGAYSYAIVSIPATPSHILVDPVYQYYHRAINFSFPETLGNLMGGPGMLLGVLIAIVLAGLITAAVAYLVGLPVLRLKGNYLSIATLGFAEIIRAIFQWGKLGPVTNGSNPLRNFARHNNFTLDIGDENFIKTFLNYFNIDIGNKIVLRTFFFVFMAALCIFIIVLLVNSSYGRAFKAIREDEIAAEAMGINLYKHKQLSFCISSFFAGIIGALLAMFMSTVMADNFRAAMTYEILLIVVLGGLGSVSGSIIGAMLFVFSSEWWLRGLDSGKFLGIESLWFRNGFRLVVFSIIIMLVVLFFRKGIMGDKEIPYMIKQCKKKLFALFTRKSKAGESNA
jgi:branched-chain amino acid transport system permease protein